jgi:hypothetical protein
MSECQKFWFIFYPKPFLTFYGILNNQNVESLFNRFLATTYGVLFMDIEACDGLG